jgi:hypothetical protein
MRSAEKVKYNASSRNRMLGALQPNLSREKQPGNCGLAYQRYRHRIRDAKVAESRRRAAFCMIQNFVTGL